MTLPRHGQGSGEPAPQWQQPESGVRAEWPQRPAQPVGQPVYAVAPPKARPNHILHLLITVVTCGMWASVWIVLAARYWRVVDYRNPAERPGMNRRTGIAIAVLTLLSIVGGVGSALTETNGTPKSVQPASDVPASAEEGESAVAQPSAEAPATPTAPKGVVVSGDYAEVIKVRSFKPGRDYFGHFDLTLRIRNLGDEDIHFMGIKVAALKGENVVATADGIVESIDAGQTVTTETVSRDNFPGNRAGITYEVEFD